MKHQTVQTGRTGWPSGNILDFHAGLPEVWVRIPAGEKRYLFVYIYRRYLINAMLLYIEFLCVLLIMISQFLRSKLCTE